MTWNVACFEVDVETGSDTRIGHKTRNKPSPSFGDVELTNLQFFKN